jgi:hypothetical protein
MSKISDHLKDTHPTMHVHCFFQKQDTMIMKKMKIDKEYFCSILALGNPGKKTNKQDVEEIDLKSIEQNFFEIKNF